MIKIPLSVVFMTSTKGHYGFDTYLETLNHFDRQIPWESVSVKVAHIKISVGQEQKAETMAKVFESRGFKVVTTTADWSRGTNHQIAYNQDLIKISKEEILYRNEHILWLEDDSIMVTHKEPLDNVLNRMMSMIAPPDIVSARFARRADQLAIPPQKVETDYFWHEHFNFQPLILRSRDFYQAAKIIESSPDAQRDVQIEMLWRLVLAQFSRSPLKHIVWNPDFAETIHLGVPDFLKIKESFNL